MKKETALMELAKKKVISSIELVGASLQNLKPFDKNIKYSPKELEPYDALSDRYIRAVETCIKYFKTYDYYLNIMKADSYRNLLQDMAKLKLISSVELWIDMRDVRNRIIHEYLPEQVKSIFDLVMGKFKEELFLVSDNIKSINYEDT